MFLFVLRQGPKIIYLRRATLCSIKLEITVLLNGVKYNKRVRISETRFIDLHENNDFRKRGHAYIYILNVFILFPFRNNVR